MPISILSFTWILDWVQGPTWRLVALIFVNVGWIPFMYWGLKEVWETWHFYIFDLNVSRPGAREFVFLAIDVPSDLELTPQAMEQIYVQLAGAEGSTNWIEEHWDGEFQEWFSFEIVSLEGYVQYIIRTRDIYRDLVEAAIYAQYPDAEISEVKDYTADVPSVWPNEEWDMFGAIWYPKLPAAYPIKLYREFEDTVRGELIDPMGALLEIMSKIGKGEQIWYQVLIKPTRDTDWLPQAQLEIDKLVEKEIPAEKPSMLQRVLGFPAYLIGLVTDALFPQFAGGDDGNKDKPRTAMMTMTPGEKATVEDMERKTGKLAYRTVIRMVYVGKKDVFMKSRGVSAVVGAIKQFNDASKNFLLPDKLSWTKALYTFRKARLYQRQQQFYNGYKGRSMYAGGHPGGYIFNVEELATIYHFPLGSVKAPLVMRTGAKKSEPPTSLPIEIEGLQSVSLPEAPEIEEEKPREESVLDKITGPGTIQSTQVDVSKTIADDDEVQFIEIPDEPISQSENQDDELGGPPPNLPIG